MDGPLSVSKKLLPPPFMGEVARWIRAKPGAAGSEGVPTFLRKVGISEYLRSKYSDSPPPFGHPPHKCGGQDLGFSDSLTPTFWWAFAAVPEGQVPGDSVCFSPGAVI